MLFRSLGVVAGQPFAIQVAVLVVVALAMTVGVYGLVAGIVRLDDLGAALARGKSHVLAAIGRGILAAAPWMLRGLSVAGTVAMFLVGGGILAHGIAPIHALTSSFGGHGTHGEQGAPPARWGMLAPMAAEAVVGMLAGTLSVAVVGLGRRLLGAGHHHA